MFAPQISHISLWCGVIKSCYEKWDSCLWAACFLLFFVYTWDCLSSLCQGTLSSWIHSTCGWQLKQTGIQIIYKAKPVLLFACELRSSPSSVLFSSTVFPQIVPADTINLSHWDNADTIWGWILFGGGYYYFHAHSDTALAPSDGAQTHVDTSCGRGVDLYCFFPTCAGVSPLPASSIDDPREVHPWCFSLFLLPCDPNYLNGQILLDVRVLLEEIRYITTNMLILLGWVAAYTWM